MDKMILSLGQLAITVSNVYQSLEFYRDILGLEFLFSPSDKLAFLQVGETRIMLTIPQGSGTVGQNSVLYFKVTNIEDRYTSFVNRGANFETEPQLVAQMEDHELWIGFLRDPDNNLIGLMEEKR